MTVVHNSNQITLCLDDSLPVDLPAKAQVEKIIEPSGRFGKQQHGLTFRDSRDQPVHRWYPYVEGFSPRYLTDVISRIKAPVDSVFDPFGGAGTALVTASWLGLRSAYSEINPFMRFVSETKVNSVCQARSHLSDALSSLREFRNQLNSQILDRYAGEVDLSSYLKAFPQRNFFEVKHLRRLLAAKKIAIEVGSGQYWLESILLLACAANAVHSSNMTRRADLRRRRPDEYVRRKVDVAAYISETVDQMMTDLTAIPPSPARTTNLSDDCRNINSSIQEEFDLAVTSPPYLNGTNYFRNTKIELWLLDLISSERELARYRQEAIAAGINNISARRAPAREFSFVEEVAERLDATAPDRRIPALVRHYFSDMAGMLEAVSATLKPSAPFIFDIGDSKYYDIYVPTHRLLSKVAESVGLTLEAEHTLARRFSRDRSPLVQVELTFRKAEK